MTSLDIIYSPNFYLIRSVSASGFCLRIQVVLI
jgi:hypothetical protein